MYLYIPSSSHGRYKKYISRKTTRRPKTVHKWISEKHQASIHDTSGAVPRLRDQSNLFATRRGPREFYFFPYSSALDALFSACQPRFQRSRESIIVSLLPAPRSTRVCIVSIHEVFSVLRLYTVHIHVGSARLSKEHYTDGGPRHAGLAPHEISVHTLYFASVLPPSPQAAATVYRPSSQADVKWLARAIVAIIVTNITFNLLVRSSWLRETTAISSY